MKVTNVSSRLHHVGNVSIAPGETKDVEAKFAKSITTKELQVVEAAEPPAPPTKAELAAIAAATAKKAADIKVAESKLASAKVGGDAALIAAAEVELAALQAE